MRFSNGQCAHRYVLSDCRCAQLATQIRTWVRDSQVVYEVGLCDDHAGDFDSIFTQYSLQTF